MHRADVRTKIREILREFYDTDTVATGGITSTALLLPVNAISYYKLGNLIQVEDEMMKVTAINEDAGNVTVIRGHLESTAAAHVADKEIHIIPEYSDRMINQCVDLAIGDTYPWMWIETVDETLTTSTTAREYTIPTGLTAVPRIQVADTNGNYQENRDYQLIGTKIQFAKDFASAGLVIRCIGTSYQALLTDDSTALTISDEQAQYLWYDGAWHAIQQRFAHRLKATEYSAALSDRAGQPIELVNMANNLRRTVESIKNREYKAPMAGYMMRPRR